MKGGMEGVTTETEKAVAALLQTKSRFFLIQLLMDVGLRGLMRADLFCERAEDWVNLDMLERWLTFGRQKPLGLLGRRRYVLSGHSSERVPW